MKAKMNLSHKAYISLAVPFILSTVTQPLLGAVDTGVAGHLADPVHIGGVSVGAVMFNTLYWLLGFLRVTTTGLSAQAGNCRNQKSDSLYRPLLLAVVSSFMILLFHDPLFHTFLAFLSPESEVATSTEAYFRILIWGAPAVLTNYVVLGWLMGRACLKESLTMQIGGNLLNILLDLFFVFRLHYGVAGIAFATLISQYASLFMGICFLVKKGYVGYPAWERILDKAQLWAMIKMNLNMFLRTACLLIQVNVFAATSSSYGTLILSANAILLQIQSIISYMFDGLANTSSVFAGRAKGKKQKDAMVELWKVNGIWTVAFMIMITITWVLLQKPVLALFTDFPEVLEIAGGYGFWITLFPIAAGFGLTYYGVFTGATETAPVRNAAFLSLAAFLASWHFGTKLWQNHGLWLSLLVFYLGRGAFLLPCLPVTIKGMGDSGKMQSSRLEVDGPGEAGTAT